MDTYVRGLQHRFFHSSLNILLVKPGPTLTAMTTHLPNSEGFASASVVAQDILVAIAKNKKVLYTPKKWRLIMFIVRLMPQTLFNRTNF
jgi:short-subunit dehydrogenase